MDKRYEKYALVINHACSIDTALLDISEKSITGCEFCKNLCKKCDLINTHTYGTYESSRWGGIYTYFCHIGLTFIASPIYDEYGTVLGGTIAGPVILGEITNYYDDETITHLCDTITSIDTKKATSIAEIMKVIAVGTADDEKSKLLNDMYEVSSDISANKDYKYPIEMERSLQSAISMGDKIGANEILNKMLGHIFFSSGGDLNIMKARALELAVLLSRASIEGGADVTQIIGLNNKYIQEIRNLNSMDDLSRWLISVMNIFSGYVFDFTDIKHSDVIHKTIRYIKDNYSDKITLENIADHVYLSKAYLSKLFKEETNMNITNFINKVRIEKGKSLLLNSNYSIIEISSLVGFDDQSYFTKIFTKLVGATPGKYRASKGKIVK